ncbi:MAG: ADP-glyceromanno-heptose 6-epimerase [Candidatus Omnitrophica bacterium]|nr:ADP-glyceromanno-heptose 6-epimerase [Candidatus Omnitrophota bacterium]
MVKSKEVIILTGGAGFIGSCFLWKLNQEGIDNIIVVDNLRDGEKWRNLVGKRFIDYIHKDNFLESLEAGKILHIKTIIHLGACTSTILNAAAYFIKNNYEYSKRLAAWADAHAARFLYASSAATYGDGSCGYDDSEKNLLNLKPLNIYGFSKHLFDLWLLKNGLLKKVTGFKFFNVFGPNEYHKGEMMSVICKRFSDIRSGRPICLFKSYRREYPDGAQKRDFIYVKDVVNAMYYFFNNPDKTGIFNLGNGKARSWNDLARAMYSALGKEPKIEYIEMPDWIKNKYQYFTQASIKKLKDSGFPCSFMAFEDSVKDYMGYLEEGKYL